MGRATGGTEARAMCAIGAPAQGRILRRDARARAARPEHKERSDARAGRPARPQRSEGRTE